MADLTDIIERLAKAEVDFVLVGGLAAVTYGSSMATQDIDICCSLAPDNLLRIQSALANLNPVHRMTTNLVPLELTEKNCMSLKNLYLETDWGQLDCLGEILGLGGFEEVKHLSETIELDGIECRILQIDALITAKKAMGRPKDIETIKQLEVIQREREEK
jgi:predicted nucleotidyltransferase